MKLTQEQIAKLNEAAKPLIQWMRDNCHPHCTAIVDSEQAEVAEGMASVHPLPPQD